MKEAELEDVAKDGMTEEERADSVINSLLVGDDEEDERELKAEIEVEAT
jgi:hypothetical protein